MERPMNPLTENTTSLEYYIESLEDYCDWLEEQFNSVKKSLLDLDNVINKLKEL